MTATLQITTFVGREVYLDSGVYLGVVEDLRLDLDEERVSGLLVADFNEDVFPDLDTGAVRGVVVPYRAVADLGDIVQLGWTAHDVEDTEVVEDDGSGSILSTVRRVGASLVGGGEEEEWHYRPDGQPPDEPLDADGTGTDVTATAGETAYRHPTSGTGTGDGTADAGADAETDAGATDEPDAGATAGRAGDQDAPDAGDPDVADDHVADDRLAGERRVPDAVPGGPDVDVAYGALEHLERVASGGDADVYRARAATDGEDAVVAVKEPRLEGTMHADDLDRFEREADTWSRLDDHEGVVDLLAWDVEPVPWLAMEYMDGGSLADRLGDVDATEAVGVGVRVCRAVEHAHERGVSHLDLKPANVLFRETPAGTWDAPKVGDWGLSRRLLDDDEHVAGFSRQYAAPEQLDDAFGEPDHATDVYQLGALLYATVVGEPPFDGGSKSVARAVVEDDPVPPTERADELPAALEDVLLTALSRRKRDRYEHVVLLRKDLESLLP
jgi:sporulation protein YlmC with PRC-barrel domain/tRNA A-37 threonylcarbamoyl transferase component Bud32